MSDIIGSAVERHGRAALLFSGGKDSLACLELARPYLDKITVTWVNTGSVFPEIDDLMARVRSEVPHFLEVSSNVESFVAMYGTPADVVPINFTELGRLVSGKQGLAVSSFMDCCRENIWLPLHSAWRRLGVTAVIRGQRDLDAKRSPYRNGSEHEGVEFVHPIEDWTDDQVRGYLAARGVEIDERLTLSHSSLDCRVCTAYLDESADRLAYLKKRHPQDAAYVVTMVNHIGAMIRHEIQPMCDLLEGN